MKHLFGKVFAAAVPILIVLIFSSAVTFAADPPRGIPSGGKGKTEVAAIEDMKLSTIKRVLAQITERNEDPASPYQQLVNRYREFIAQVHVDKKSKNSSGAFVVTGRIEIKYPELQAELGKLVKEAHASDVTREVYVFVRFVGQSASAEQIQTAENVILQRYMTRLKENKFNVANADEVIGELNQTRSMNFDQFVEFVKQKSAENPAICTAVVGEIIMAKEEEDADGYTASCEINIRALDCLNNFKVIDNYEGSDILRMKDLNRIGQFMLEKAAVTSSKSIADALVKYWSNN